MDNQTTFPIFDTLSSLLTMVAIVALLACCFLLVMSNIFDGSWDPDHTLVVSPDNKSLQEISVVIRERLKEEGLLTGEAYRAVVLVDRTGED